MNPLLWFGVDPILASVLQCKYCCENQRSPPPVPSEIWMPSSWWRSCDWIMSRKFITSPKRRDSYWLNPQHRWAKTKWQNRHRPAAGLAEWMETVSELWQSRLITGVSVSLLLQDDRRISAKCRDAKVEDLWSLTSFFGYSTQTFVLAVNLLDRFLAMMRVWHASTW